MPSHWADNRHSTAAPIAATSLGTFENGQMPFSGLYQAQLESTIPTNDQTKLPSSPQKPTEAPMTSRNYDSFTGHIKSKCQQVDREIKSSVNNEKCRAQANSLIACIISNSSSGNCNLTCSDHLSNLQACLRE
ncbi:MAG: hypothetical protein MHMPM18_001065 [Marteilia pararefringens]